MLSMRTIVLLCAALACTAGGAVAKPNRVILLSFDGMHQSDLAWGMANLPNLMMMANNAVVYTNAYIQSNSDSFPGVLALTAGANPKTTGVYYDDSYSRDLWAPMTNCSGGRPLGAPGAEIVLDESVDINNTLVNGGGNSMGRGSIDPAMLPLNANCTPVYPHTFNRANTIFNVAKAAGMKTAWTDKHPAYDLLNGPSGDGIDQLYTPEINSLAPDGSTWTAPRWTPHYDAMHTNAIVNWIMGNAWNGSTVAGWSSPQLMGGNFQSISTAQKIWNHSTAGNASAPTYKGGYGWDGVTPNAILKYNFAALDTQLGQIMNALAATNQLSNYTVIVTAKHGQSPKDATLTNLLPTKGASSVIGVLAAAGIQVGQATQDDVSLIWLANSTQTAAASNALLAHKGLLGITDCYSGASLLALGWTGNPATDPRAPDLICSVVPGTIYVGNPAGQSKAEEHGGINEDDRHVGLLVWQKGQTPRVVNQTVYTTQVAVSAVKLLGLNASSLMGVQREGMAPLPGITY